MLLTAKGVFRSLTFGHLAVSLALLPLTLFLGFVFFPILLAPILWLLYLGFRVWNARPGVIGLLRKTHRIGLVIGLLLVLYGVFALEAAAQSSEQGGGLLGGFGFIPLGAGILLAVLSMSSLWAARRWPDGYEDRDTSRS